MIGVEARFLIVTSNFLEEIGVDLDFVFNSGDAGYDRAINSTTGAGITDLATGAPVLMPRPFSRAGVYPNVPGVGQPFTPGAVPIQPYSQAGFVPGPAASPVIQRHDADRHAERLNRPGQSRPAEHGHPRLDRPGVELRTGPDHRRLVPRQPQVDFLIRATQANKRSSIVQARG